LEVSLACSLVLKRADLTGQGWRHGTRQRGANIIRDFMKLFSL